MDDLMIHNLGYSIHGWQNPQMLRKIYTYLSIAKCPCLQVSYIYEAESSEAYNFQWQHRASLAGFGKCTRSQDHETIKPFVGFEPLLYRFPY